MGKNQISDMNKAKNSNFNTMLSGCLGAGVLPGIEIARLTGIKVAQLVSDSLNERPYFKLVVVPATATEAFASGQALLAQVNQTKFADDPRLSMLTSLVEGLGKCCVADAPAECAEATAETVSEPQEGPVEAFAGDSLTSDTPEIQMALVELPEPVAEVPMIEAVPEVLATPAPVKVKSAPKKEKKAEAKSAPKKADAKKASPAKSAPAKKAKPAPKKAPEFVTA